MWGGGGIYQKMFNNTKKLHKELYNFVLNIFRYTSQFKTYL